MIDDSLTKKGETARMYHICSGDMMGLHGNVEYEDKHKEINILEILLTVGWKHSAIPFVFLDNNVTRHNVHVYTYKSDSWYWYCKNLRLLLTSSTAWFLHNTHTSRTKESSTIYIQLYMYIRAHVFNIIYYNITCMYENLLSAIL